MKKFFLVLMVLALSGASSFAQEEPGEDIVWWVESHDNYDIVFSPDSKRIASIGPDEVQVYDVENGALLQSLPHPRQTNLDAGIAWSPDGRYIAAAGNFGVVVYDAVTYEQVPEGGLNYTYGCLELAFSPDNKYLVVGGSKWDEAVLFWNLEDFTLEKTVMVVDTPAQGLRMSEVKVCNTCNILVAGGFFYDPINRYYKNVDWQFDYTTLEEMEFSLITDRKQFFNTQDKYVSAGEIDDGPNGIHVYRISDNQEIKYIPCKAEFSGIQYCLSPDDKYLAISDFEPLSYSIYDLNTSEKKYTYTMEPKAGTKSMDCSKDYNYIVVGSGDYIFLFNAYWNTTGVEDNPVMDIIETKPNPAENLLEIEINLLNSGQIQLFASNNVAAKICDFYSGYKETGPHKFTWDTKNIPNGAYFITLKTEQGSFTEKVIINK